MIPRALRIADHPLLCQLAGYLAGVEVPHGYREKGNYRLDIAAGPPAEDRPRPTSYRWQAIPIAAPPEFLPDDVRHASLNYFPTGGAGMGWHTDSTMPGWRVYLPRLLGPARGEFHFVGGSFLDSSAFAIAFLVGRDSWHAVTAYGERMSIGIRIVGDATARALGLI